MIIKLNLKTNISIKLIALK